MARDVRVVIEGNADSLLRATAEAGLALKALDSTGGRTGSSLSSKLGSAFKIIAPLAVGAGLAFLQLSGNMAALAPILPVITVGLGLLLAPFASLAAILVALVGPVVLLTGLLGLLGGAFFLAGMHGIKFGLAPAVERLMGQFHLLEQTLTTRFMPVFRFLISSASEALTYFDKIAKLPLAAAFKSLSTTGVFALRNFLIEVGRIVSNPIRLAFQFAFGAGGQNVNNALGKLWDQVIAFFTRRPVTIQILPGGPGGRIRTVGQSIIDEMQAWFGRHDFSKTGARWGQEIAGAMVDAIKAGVGRMLQSSTGRGFLGGAGIGAIVGAFTPVGPLIGTTLGAGIGTILGHYWPRIAAASKTAWHAVERFAVSAFHTVAGALKAVLGPTAWNNIGQLARTIWGIVKTLGVTAFRLVGDAIKIVWTTLRIVGTILDALFIKTGLWKVGVFLVHAAFAIVTRVILEVALAVADVVRKVSGLATFVGGALVSAFGGVLSAVQAIIGGIQAAIGFAQSLANALSHPANYPITGPNRRPRRAAGGPVGAGQTYLVGERGPELLHMGAGSGFVSPNSSLGGGPTYVIHVHGDVIDKDGFFRAMQTAQLQARRRGFQLTGPGGTG